MRNSLVFERSYSFRPARQACEPSLRLRGLRSALARHEANHAKKHRQETHDPSAQARCQFDYAVEAARASIDWVFATFAIDEIIHCIEPLNAPSQMVARRLGAGKDRQADLFGKPTDIWLTSREKWMGQT